MTKLEKVLIEQLSKVSGVDITAILAAIDKPAETQTPKQEAPADVKPAPKKTPKQEATVTETPAPKAEAPAKPAAEGVVSAFLEGDKAARGAIVSLASLEQLREINEAAKIGFDLSKYDDDSLAVARNKVMRWVNRS